MTEDMLATMAAFPAATEGVGNEPLAPSEVEGRRHQGVRPHDGTGPVGGLRRRGGRRVDLNGIVPGPRIDLEVGDKVELRV